MSRTANFQINAVLRRGNTFLKPKPFAGKYPTRIAWDVSIRGQKRHYSYRGKPNRIMALRLLKHVANPAMRWISYYEVDQRNVLCSFYTEQRGIESAIATLQNGWFAYHPVTSVRKGWEWMLSAWWKVVLNDLPVYSPIAKLNDRLHVLPYTTWYKSISWIDRD